ncbi:4'-phosphopantetheinyl transferase family protein [Streptomyces apocyni]|uniref:4'-phosphopantetheinyl transferase family protein n=1 Tax=Streptomyces apocyni TaxID=2654677 RepID=UPI0012EA6F18|nr:4'-phosphopantetheinyl transferase superfamily protein [Streptomyces apocyni]
MTPPIAHPLPADGPRGPWGPISDELARSGNVVVYGVLSAWVPKGAHQARPLLGRDWNRYETLAHPKMRERFLASRLLLRHTAAAAIDTTPDLVDLAYQPGGRPFVRGCDQIDVSLSHTEDLMVVGITHSGRIGVDVELADRKLAGTGSELQACTPFEKRQLDAGGDAVRNDNLVRMWTLKEAYSKALGQGLRFRFTEFGFALNESEGATLVRPDGTPVGGQEWRFGTFGVDRYVVSVAVHDTGFGSRGDLSVGTTLDEGMLDALLGGPPQGIQPTS